MTFDPIRLLHEEILKLIQGLVRLELILQDKPKKYLTQDKWEGICIADIYLGIFSSYLILY